ncbi:MAG: adenosylmethionine decarboxylase [Patescibacteria group bacterium]
MGILALGTHFIIELRDCEDSLLLNDTEEARKVLIEAAQKSGATVLFPGVYFHQFSPHGITGIVPLAESHLTIHTWPEYCYAAVDIFVCGGKVKPNLAARYIIDKFGSRDPKINEIERGLNLGPHKPEQGGGDLPGCEVVSGTKGPPPFIERWAKFPVLAGAGQNAGFFMGSR